MVKNFQDNDVRMLDELRRMAKSAEEAEKLIKDTWTFKIGENEIFISRNPRDGSEDSLTHDGVWQRKWLHMKEKDIEVKCTAKEIFKLLKAENACVNKLPCADTDGGEERAIFNKSVKFREFLRLTKEVHDKLQAF